MSFVWNQTAEAVIERAGEPCDDAEKAKQSIKHCIDLALDDGYAKRHELVPRHRVQSHSWFTVTLA